ncbi:hypothetical protein BHE74_00042175 [Ensete ventricosum]|nr:hypothetical protein BHE74_00042175 [Ensete ventricosum]
MAAASPSSLLLPRPQTLSPLLLNGRLPSPPATRRAPSLSFWSPTRDPRRFAASSSPAPGAVEVKPKLDGETGGRSAKDKEEGLRVVLPTNESSEKLLRIRHTRLFPGSKVTIGPWIDNGFYYDFDMEPLTDKDLKRIKKEMDDAHIFCLDDQIKYEIRGVLDLTEEILLQFGFNKYEVNLSTRPEKFVGTDDIWEKATAALRDALDDKGWAYQIDEGGGAFYGPKIDLKIEDALGRKWQCSTVQASCLAFLSIGFGHSK